jgi:hypothetical protein
MDMVFMWCAYSFIVIFKIVAVLFWPILGGVGGYLFLFRR